MTVVARRRSTTGCTSLYVPAAMIRLGGGVMLAVTATKPGL
jgi:hypothetical protein